MASNMHTPEYCCLEPDHFKKYFRSFYWNDKRIDVKSKKSKIGKKDKRKVKSGLSLTNTPSLLGNASQFAVFAAARSTIVSRWAQTHAQASEVSEESGAEDHTPVHVTPPCAKLPKITGIGLRTVFALVSQARSTNAAFCEQALKALLDVLQGHSPEDLHHEPNEIIVNLHKMLCEVSGGGKRASEPPTALTAAASSCLVALSVARGEAEMLLSAAATLIISSPSLAEQNITIPANLITLQRSVQTVLLGTPSRNTWLSNGVPHQSLFTSFPVDLPSELSMMQGDLIVRSLASDGRFLYIYTSKGLIKLGSGYGGTINQHVYAYKPDFFPSERHGWLGYCKNKLYVRMGRKKPEIFQVDKETLDIMCVIRLEQGLQPTVDSKASVFSDGLNLGMISLSNQENLSVKLYNPDELETGHPLAYRHEFSLHLLRNKTLALGWAPFEEGDRRRVLEPLDQPVASQLDDSEEDRVLAVSAGQDFALLRTTSGKVYYTGKSSSLGYKTANPQYGRWALMKETQFSRNDPQNAKMSRIVQVALGHEGVHAILVVDDGSVFFTGIARRGEDGDLAKHRRQPKPCRPKKILKAEGHYVTYAACNYGSTALVTRQGLLLMLGKDTRHCDTTGVVTALRHERIVQVALGKAHAVALTSTGLIYTFGINNKGQCGREFGYTKEKTAIRHQTQSSNDNTTRLCAETEHIWTTDVCHICVICRECTGFSTACQYAEFPDRLFGEKCGCGEGDSGCSVCGVCRRCAKTLSWKEPEDDEEVSVASDSKSGKEGIKYSLLEGGVAGGDVERESNLKVTCLPPARIAIPGGHKITMVACGLHHTVMMTDHGEVMTFGSNQCGQLGAGNTSVHHRIVRARLPRAASVAAGSSHTAVLTRDGELFTFGSYQKGALGRQWVEEAASGSRSERAPVWYAAPGKVTRLGPDNATRAVWITASGDQTFVQVSQTLVKTDTLFSATITANKNTIVILPNRPEHAFKCITINKSDGTCHSYTGPEQVDFVNSLACLDPLYDVIWCYQPQKKVMKCFNILVFNTHSLQKCSDPNYHNEITYTGMDNDYEYPNFGPMKKLEDFKNLETVETVCNDEDHKTESAELIPMSILNQELAIPSFGTAHVTRLHVALHLLGCLDSLTFVQDCKLSQVPCKRDYMSSPATPTKDDFMMVNRFESHGGGWGYSGHSVEAIRFMVDTDMLLGGYCLFGGRGDYTAKIKLFDLGLEGGEQEGDGELLAETDEVVFECPPRDKFPVLFDTPIPIVPNRWFVAWACINGPSSDCGSSGQTMVINEDAVFHFKTSKKSNNGTDVNAGQIPCLLYSIMNPDQPLVISRSDHGDPLIILSRKISKKVTIGCFKSLVSLLHWAWTTLKGTLLDTNGHIPNNYQKLLTMKYQRRLVYVVRACLRLVKFYINEVFPQHQKKRNSADYMIYTEVIAEVRTLLQSIIGEPAPSCSVLPAPVSKKTGKSKIHRPCGVQFQLELTNAILQECHKTLLTCFYAFFSTPVAKWNHLCSLLFHVKDGVLPASKVRELTSTTGALCVSKSLREVLQHVVPLTRSYALAADARKQQQPRKAEAPSKSATVPRVSQRAPPVPPRASKDKLMLRPQASTTDARNNHTEWNLLDVIPRLLDIVMTPIKRQMMTRHCSQPHDHGEQQHGDQLAKYCCKLLARIIAELALSATSCQDDTEFDSSATYLSAPSRFMRLNQTRSWNTGNGSPDAVCFTVDKPGVLLVGVGVYGGLGNYDYELELLHDVRQLRGSSEESNPAHCWFSVEVTHGTFSPSDCHNEIAQLLFPRPIPLKEDVRYALRFCNHGGRTSNGDCGLPSVKGPDGTTFRFTSCSLSFNGTTLARGQIPYIIYYGSPSLISSAAGETGDATISAIRATTLRVASIVVERTVDLFRSLRNELTVEDIRRNANVLHSSPAVNILIPYVLANLEGLSDSKSVVTILELIQRLLPHVAALNLLVSSADDPGYSGIPDTTTSQLYTWIESDHPYKQASVTNIRVLFPPSVTWVVLEMDPRSVTAQAEDSLAVYAASGASQRQHCHCDPRTPRETARKGIQQKLLQLAAGESGLYENATEEIPCLEYNCTYVAITPKMSNIASEWPQRAILVPGNEVIFSLETATDYLNEYKGNGEESRFGFRCLCVGYEGAPLTLRRCGLRTLELGLGYAGAACAAKLLSPDIDIPPLGPAVILDFQNSPQLINNPQELDEASNKDLFDSNESLLLSRGLEISTPPTIHQILMGQPLARCQSTERQFLRDFVSGAESTAGGRLACWLQPDSRVEPSLCDVHLPSGVPRVGTPLLFGVVPRDQYGELVRSPALKVEILVQLSEASPSGRRNRRASQQDAQLFGGHGSPPVEEVPYEITTKDTMRFHAITLMKAFINYSFEELRVAAPSGPGAARVPPERLSVRPILDGTFSAAWMPRVPGSYAVKCTLDETPTQHVQELSVDVKDALSAGIGGGGGGGGGASTSAGPCPQSKEPPVVTRPTKMRKFQASNSAGLRIRVHPSLQSEEIGVIPPNANVAFTEELQNNDGTWLRLGPEAVKLYLEAGAPTAALSAEPLEAWCLQYHQQLDRTLLVPLEAQPFTDKNGEWGGTGKNNQRKHSPSNPWTQDSDNDNDPNDDTVLSNNADTRKGFDFSTHSDSADESDTGAFVFGMKEEISMPKKINEENFGSGESLSHLESTSKMSNKANGNGCSEEWWGKDGSRRSSKSSLEIPINDEPEIEKADNLQGGRLTQAGTQTSPENVYDNKTVPGQFTIGSLTNEEKNSPKSSLKERAEKKSRLMKRSVGKHSSPTRSASARSSPSKSAPHKYAMSPTQAECYRAIFAALLWHEGIVHDAMACAAYLKFHPQLPKQGVRVVTRTPSGGAGGGAAGGGDVTSAARALQHQRHSVEVSSAGKYLHIQPSTLESLTRSANNANANRSRNKRAPDAAGPPISEEEAAHTSDAESLSAGCVVQVLPPALRALVALWDKFSEARELGVTPEKHMKEEEIERRLCGVDRTYFLNNRTKKGWKASPNSKTPYSVNCELCNGIAVTPPLAAHMRHTHPGCKTPCTKGYDRAGAYVDAGPALTACGQLAQEYSNGAYFNTSHANAAYYLWYMYCERCRDKAIKASSSYKTSKPKIFSDSNFERIDVHSSATKDTLDHCAILENAMFLMDLAPVTSSDSPSSSYGARPPGNNTGSPPPPANSLWQPAPPFQSLDALGVSPFKEDEPDEYDPRYDTLRRWQPPLFATGDMYERLLEERGVGRHSESEGLFHPGQSPRFPRSVSMGQAGRELAPDRRTPASTFDHAQDTLGGGSSLLAQPSAALQKLVGCGRLQPNDSVCIVSAFEVPKFELDTLLMRPVMTFVRGKRDLDAVQQRMDAAVRISTVRQYSLEALNWLLRSVTQPTSLHDVMWWFCGALEQYSKYDGANENIKKNSQLEVAPVGGTQSWVVAGGGRAGRGVRAALHALLQSVADVMPSLPPTCPALLQAVRCWALEYAPSDHIFLHRSQVFSVISKILSHTEEDLYEESVVGLLPSENCHTGVCKDGFIWVCPDVTAWCDISVSSRPASMSALTDGTTETFWESGEEDRNKSKWIQISCPGGVFDEKPHLICLHIDNTRDTVNKTLVVSFLYSGTTTEMFHMQDIEVDQKSAAWVCYTLPRNAVPPLRVRCELRGPDSGVRVRQLKVLAVPALRHSYQFAAQNTSHYKMMLERVQPAALILHHNIEAETLRVFRLITSQVFGKLLEWDVGSSETGGEGSFSRAPSVGEDGNADETDLREHVVGILFSGSKLTNLQKQVMRHIVMAIGAEAQKAREEWESALLADEPDDGSDRPTPTETVEPSKQQDNYCFEMLSLLLALSGSAVGREHLAKRLELLPDLLSLLHTGSDRVQRQVISLLRRMIGEISPQKMLAALNFGNDSSTFRITLMDNLVTYVSKAINVQVKEKGFIGTSASGSKDPTSPRAPGSVTMGGSIIPIPPGFWFMRGQTSKKHAHLVAKLLTDMAEDKISGPWGAEARSSLANYMVRLAGVPDGERRPGSCIAACAIWLALGALCVIEESYVELIAAGLCVENSSGPVKSSRGAKDPKESRPFCINHDDSETLAVIDCRSCGPLCHECDRCLHLNRAARTHHRQICKEEESSIRVDIHEGCGRAKLFWLLLLIDRRTLKALAEFRGMGTQLLSDEATARPSLPGPPGLAGICRFCGTQGNSGLLAIGNVCADHDCQEHGRNACCRVLPCGHLCGGVRGERGCLPCLYGCAGSVGSAAAPALRQDADDMCMICFTDPLAAAPAIQLRCGHVFHQHCCKIVLSNKWIGPRITFSFSQCPICKEDMEHPILEELLAPIRQLQEEVRRKGLMRLEYEGLGGSPAIAARHRGDAASYALERYAYYVCFKCKKAYFGGQARCDAESNTQYDPEELVCGGCSDIAGARTCPKHGADFLEYKCRYCCSVAVFFCFGTSHFCNTCHDDFQRVTNIAKHALPSCPAGPKAKQLEGTSEDCPLHIKHPPTGEEFALGCGVCRNSHTF